MKERGFSKKNTELEKVSRPQMEGLLKIWKDFSRLNHSLSSFFASAFEPLTRFIIQALDFRKILSGLYSSRLMILPRFESLSKMTTSQRDTEFHTENEGIEVPFLFNIIRARDIGMEFTRRLVKKTPKSSIPLKPSHIPNFGTVEETDATNLEEAPKNFDTLINKLSNLLESKFPKIIKRKSSSPLKKYDKSTISHKSAQMPEYLPIDEIDDPILEEEPKNVVTIVSDLHRVLESKYSPIAKGIISTFNKFHWKKLLLGPEPFLPKLINFPISRENHVMSLSEKPEPKISQTSYFPSYDHDIIIEPENLGLYSYSNVMPRIALKNIPILNISNIIPKVFSPDTVSPIQTEKLEPTKTESDLSSTSIEKVNLFEKISPDYLAKLPSSFLKRGFSVLKRITSPLESETSPPKQIISTSPQFLTPSTPTPLPAKQVGGLLSEISPYLTSWIYGLSEILRGTSFSLSAVPVAAASAERIVSETLTQPVSSFKDNINLYSHDSVSHDFVTSRIGKQEGPIKVEAFRLPSIVSAILSSNTQKYPLQSDNLIKSSYGNLFESMRSTEENQAHNILPEIKTYSKLPTVIALAAAESLISHRLFKEFNALTKEIRGSQPSFGEKLNDVGPLPPVRNAMFESVRATAPSPVRTFESSQAPIQRTPLFSPRYEPFSPSPKTINISMPSDSPEEGLRNLERKINKIISDQIRRYYGSIRI
jgi:hypothetical protein